MITILKRILAVGLVVLVVVGTMLTVVAEKADNDADDDISQTYEEIGLTVVDTPAPPQTKEIPKDGSLLPEWATFLPDEKLMLHFIAMQEKYSLDDFEMEQILKICWNESRFNMNISDNYNSNGSTDTGLMQINSCNWGWLSEKGLNVHNWEDNVEAGVLMYSDLRSKYDLEKTIASYQCGEFSGYSSTAYSRKVVSMDLPTFIQATQ